MAQRMIELTEDERWSLRLNTQQADELARETGFNWIRIHKEATRKARLGLHRLRAAVKQAGRVSINLYDAQQILDRETLKALHHTGKVRLDCEAPPYVVYLY